MPVVTGEVEAVSKKFAGKTGYLVNGTWYNCADDALPNPEPSKGDTITFEASPKRYMKSTNIVSKGSGGRPSGGTKGWNPKSVGNIGVEVGHAANLAMGVVARMGLEPGSEEEYSQFARKTVDIFRLMKSIRKTCEGLESKAALMSEASDEVHTDSKDEVNPF